MKANVMALFQTPAVLVVLVLSMSLLAVPGQSLAVEVAHSGDSGAGARAALKGLDESGKMQISEEDRCPVCAMTVARYPKFASAIQLKDGRTYYFCGTGCMIRTWLHPEVFLGVRKDAIRVAVVRDYFTGIESDATEVIWVAGSDVVGPMGPAVVPIRNEKDVAAFQSRHGGEVVFKLLELDDEKWESIRGGKL